MFKETEKNYQTQENAYEKIIFQKIKQTEVQLEKLKKLN